MILMDTSMKKERQQFMKNNKWYNRLVDGDWGRYTKDATGLFQKYAKSKGKYNALIDKDWGPLTEKAYQGLKPISVKIPINTKTSTNTKIPTNTKTPNNTETPLSSKVTKKISKGLVWGRQLRDSTCACRSLWMILKALDINKTEEQLSICCKTKHNDPNKGTEPSKLRECANNIQGVILTVEEWKGISQIVSTIDKGYYIILHGKTIKEMGYNNPYGHYVVIGGYDLDNNMLYLYDPSEKRLDGTKRNGPYWIGFSAIDKFVKGRGASTPVKILRKK